MRLAHDAQGVVDFLTSVHPDGPWVVSAINRDHPEESQRINSQIFGPGSRGDLAVWLDRFNSPRPHHSEVGLWTGYNIYYAVNPLREGVRRANKLDVSAVRYLHVDLDPRAFVPGEDGEGTNEERAAYLQKEIERIAAKLGAPPNDIPKPHVAVLSGGGCNALWRLEEPIRLDHTAEKAEEAERFNIALAVAFGGDHCHDVSRILRMPYTVNWPDEGKRQKGRVAAMTRVLWTSADSYPLGLFRSVEPRQTNGVGSGRGRPKTIVPGSVEPITDVSRIASYAKYKERVTDKLLKAIALGVDADPEHWKGDRSAVLLFVACQMLRAGIPEAQVYAVITQPTFGCSAHVLKHKSGARRVAQRTIDRAKDLMEGDEGDDGGGGGEGGSGIGYSLLDMNDQFFVVGDYGAKCVVMQESKDPVNGRPMLRVQSPDHFYNRFAHRTIVPPAFGKKEPSPVNLAKWWFHHPRSRRVERVAFAPGRELPDNIYNLWQGFAVDPVPGDAHLPYLEHLRVSLCNEDEANYRYLLGWLAQAVQHPDRPGQVVVVLRGGQGTGKGTFANYFGRLWGRHYMQVMQTKHLVGEFNHHLADLVVLFADEAFFAGDKTNADVLKGLITEERLATTRKHYDTEQVDNFLHIIMASNKSWVVPTDGDDRRYFVLDLPQIQHPPDYFPRLRKSMDLVEDGGQGGLCNLLYFLQTYDLSSHDPWKRPRTSGLTTQKLLTLSAMNDWWYDKLHAGMMPRGRKWRDPVPTDELWNDYILHATKTSDRREKKVTFGKELHALVPGVRTVTRKVKVWNDDARAEEQVSSRCYEFPGLAECRRLWDEKMGTTTAWTDPDDPDF
jgi:hypothetical protein